MRVRDPLALLAAALLVVACGKDDASSKKAPAAAAHEEHKSPHGGEVVELGEEEAHLELMHDHAGGNVTVYVLDKDVKTPVAVAAPKIMIQGKDGKPAEFSLTAVNPGADGTADTWKGSHEALKTDPWNGRIVVTVKGKEHRAALEPADHGHDHK